MFAQRPQQQETPLRKQLKLIADLAHYQPVPSISAPSQGFNYTLSQQRYSEFETPRPIKKEIHPSWAKSEEDKKLTTILQTQNFNHLFPKIIKPVQKQSPQKRVKFPSFFHKERQETDVTRQRSLTHDTPMTNQEERFLSLDSQRDNESLLSFSRKQPIKIRKSVHRQQQKVVVQVSHLEEDESEGEEFEKDAVPGPGTYTYSYSDFDKKIAKSTKASFLSQSTRFPQILPKLQQSVEIPVDSNLAEKQKRRDQRIQQRKSRKLVPFNSKSPRSFEVDSLSKIKCPGPEDYSPRYGIEEELIKKIQRNFKGNFGSNEQRFPAQKDGTYQHLGPGSYEVPTIDQSQMSENFYFKSRLERF